MTKHKHYDTAYRAYYAISFSPGKRAVSACNYFDEINKEFTELGADERAFTKFESLFLASLNAKSNCMSPMITGPSNFPVARMEKMNNRERARSQEMYDFIDKVKKAIDKKNNPSSEIRSDEQNAENDRVQFFFDDKPERAGIDIMKKHGFKWSRNNNCWQRLWNNNCMYSVNHYILPELKNLK